MTYGYCLIVAAALLCVAAFVFLCGVHVEKKSDEDLTIKLKANIESNKQMLKNIEESDELMKDLTKVMKR